MTHQQSPPQERSLYLDQVPFKVPLNYASVEAGNLYVTIRIAGVYLV